MEVADQEMKADIEYAKTYSVNSAAATSLESQKEAWDQQEAKYLSRAARQWTDELVSAKE